MTRPKKTLLIALIALSTAYIATTPPSDWIKFVFCCCKTKKHVDSHTRLSSSDHELRVNLPVADENTLRTPRTPTQPDAPIALHLTLPESDKRSVQETTVAPKSPTDDFDRLTDAEVASLKTPRKKTWLGAIASYVKPW